MTVAQARERDVRAAWMRHTRDLCGQPATAIANVTELVDAECVEPATPEDDSISQLAGCRRSRERIVRIPPHVRYVIVGCGRQYVFECRRFCGVERCLPEADAGSIDCATY